MIDDDQIRTGDMQNRQWDIIRKGEYSQEELSHSMQNLQNLWTHTHNRI